MIQNNFFRTGILFVALAVLPISVTQAADTNLVADTKANAKGTKCKYKNKESGDNEKKFCVKGNACPVPEDQWKRLGTCK